MRDRQRLFHHAARRERPLATRHTSTRKNIGDFVVVERSGQRFHIDVKAGIPAPSINRIVNLFMIHAKKKPDAVLNQFVDGKEESWGKLRELSKKKLKAIIRQLRADATFIVVPNRGFTWCAWVRFLDTLELGCDSESPMIIYGHETTSSA
jgi:hypothetical protein